MKENLYIKTKSQFYTATDFYAVASYVFVLYQSILWELKWLGIAKEF